MSVVVEPTRTTLLALFVVVFSTCGTPTVAFSPSSRLTTKPPSVSAPLTPKSSISSYYRVNKHRKKNLPLLSAEKSTPSSSDLNAKKNNEEEPVVVELHLEDETESATLDDVLKESTSAEKTAPMMKSHSLNGVDDGDDDEPETIAGSKMERFRKMIPVDDELDKTIVKTALPSMVNLAVVPLVNSVDTFWVGRMGIALALAGQAAANQAFFTLFFLVNYLPTITAPLVASAVGSGDMEQAQKRVGESLFLSNLLGGLGALFLVAFPAAGLSLILSEGAPALEYARPYLRFRALSMVPALVGATGFAAFRGALDTVTPLKVSLFTNCLNLVLDPLLIFFTPLGVMGAALATALSETASGIIYLKLLLKRKLANLREILRPPSLKSLMPLILGGASMLGRQLALNIGFVFAGRRAQAMDPTGVSAAAYGIVMQIYSVGVVMHVAMQGTAAALVPSTKAKSGRDAARSVGDRMFSWCSIVGVILGLTQFLALPWLVPLFSTLPEVQEAVKVPALIASLLHFVNGPVFAGEGVMLGLGCFRDLMLVTAAGVGVMLLGLVSPMGQRLDGILWSFLAFHVFQAAAVAVHYLKIGPLAVRRIRRKVA